MEKLILAYLIKLALALRNFCEADVLSGKALAAFEDELHSLSSSLRGAGRDLSLSGDRYSEEELARYKAQIMALMKLRSHAAFAARVARHIRLLASAVSKYVNGGLVDLPTGQRLLGSIRYHRHELNQLSRRCTTLGASEALELVVKNGGKNTLNFLRKLARLLRERDQQWAERIETFEKDAVQASQDFSPSKPAIISILPCDMSLPTTRDAPIECIAVYRGLHFRRDYFSDYDILNQRLASLDQIPAYSEQARSRSEVRPGLVETQAQIEQLDEEARKIAEQLRALQGEQVKQHWAQGRPEGDRYYSMVQRYINSYGNFSTEIRQTNNIPALYQGLDFQQTPFVSFSFNPVHSIRYVLGIKTPEEQAHQRRRQGLMGELYVYLIPLTPANVERLNNILHLSAQQLIKIKTRILNEAEVNVLGGMSSSHLVGRLIVGASGFDFYDPDDENDGAMENAKLNHWVDGLAANAIGCAAIEAQNLGWKIRGYEALPDLTPSTVANPYFGVSRMPTKEAGLNAKEKREVQQQRELADRIREFNKNFSKVGGSAQSLVWPSRPGDPTPDGDEDDEPLNTGSPQDVFLFQPLAVPRYPDSVAEFLQQQGVQAPHGSLAELFAGYEEGHATPQDHNCLIHTLHQLSTGDRNGLPDFVEVRRRYRLPIGATIDAGTTGHLMAHDLGLLVQLYAIGHGGQVQNMGQVGSAAGRQVTLLQFGAHFVPLWPRQA